jgi:CRISPR-associated protein Cst2
MNKKGLTMTFVIEAESANYGEGVGNVTSLKKLTRGNGESYTYISRQALRYNIIEQMGVDNTPLGLAGSVIQFAPDATIKDYPEIDLFGYMKTNKDTKTRAAVARLSNAVALESFQADTDFLTNKGLFDRYQAAHTNEAEKRSGGNIAQSEIHHAYYSYTLTVDLDQVGVDTNDHIDLSAAEKSLRVQRLVDTLKFLYRDIKGRRENLSPIFAIGGVYDIKNPFFENRIRVRKNNLQIQAIQDVLTLDPTVKEQTSCGIVAGIFDNDQEIKQQLGAGSIGQFFSHIKEQIQVAYE